MAALTLLSKSKIYIWVDFNLFGCDQVWNVTSRKTVVLLALLVILAAGDCVKQRLISAGVGSHLAVGKSGER
jgi:hypothetical protein